MGCTFIASKMLNTVQAPIGKEKPLELNSVVNEEVIVGDRVSNVDKTAAKQTKPFDYCNLQKISL
jgi:hypothetical protein